MVFDSCGVSELQRSMFATPELTLWEGYPSVFCIRSFKFRIQGHVGSRMFQVFTQYTIYIYLENRMDIFFCPLWVLPVTDVFFVQLRILFFDCEGLFKSFDNTVFGHPPTVSKRGISVQSGANWES